MDFALMRESIPQLLGGLGLTLQLVSLSLAIGFVLALGIALMRLSPYPPLSGFARGYVFVFRGTPILVQIFLIYFGLAQFEWIRESILWTILREPFWAGIIALSLNTAAYTSEILRGGIESVPYGQVEAARACGMGRVLGYRRIILPQAFRQALPAYGNEMILMVKASSLVSTITLLEITGIARGIISRTFSPVEIFLVAGALYLAINFGITLVVQWLEGRLTPHLRRS